MFPAILLLASCLPANEIVTRPPRPVPTLRHEGRTYYRHRDGIYRHWHPDAKRPRPRRVTSERPPEPRRVHVNRFQLPPVNNAWRCVGGR